VEKVYETNSELLNYVRFHTWIMTIGGVDRTFFNRESDLNMHAEYNFNRGRLGYDEKGVTNIISKILIAVNGDSIEGMCDAIEKQFPVLK